MKSSIISFDSKTAADFQPSILSLSQPNSITNSDIRSTLRISRAIKENPSQFTHALALEVKNLLGHISLSAEVINSNTIDNELKSCLDVILRSTLRINNLVTIFLINQQVDAILAEKGYNGAQEAG